MNSTFVNLRDELLNDESIDETKRVECPEIIIKLNGVTVKALIDTGSHINAISEEWFHCNQHLMGKIDLVKLTNTSVKGAIGNRSKNISKQVFLQVDINNYTFDSVFFVVPELIKDCIIGMEMLSEEGCVINLPAKRIQFPTKGEVEILSLETQHEGNPIKLNIEEKINELQELTANQRIQLQQLLINNQEVFKETPGRISVYQHKLEVNDPTPYCLKGWPVPLKHQDAVKEEIRRMVDYGIIERAITPYVNPMVVVVKKNQSVRICLDARRLNHVTIPDYEGAIPVNEVLSRCGQIRVMSTIDLTSSFWQIPLDPESRNFTGFIYDGKCYRYTVTPFGLKTSLASLTRGLDRALTEQVKQFTIIYVDDCLIISKSVEEHLEHIKLLLENFKQANLTVNLKKSQFFRRSIDYLGYCLSVDGIQASPDKVAAIQRFPTPRNQKQLKGFLGLTNFYNRFTSKYAESTRPLLQLLKKGQRFTWTEEIDRCFNEVKRLFINTVMIRHPNPNKRYYLQTDTSKYAIGGQLYQLDEDNQMGVIAFTSRVLKGAELNYFTTELELLSVVHCLKKFRMYVLGSPLTIITDNKALTFIQKCHLNNSRITRWILGIQEYDFDIVYCKGKDNVVADTLSRYPEDLDQHSSIFERQDEVVINQIQIKLNKDIQQKLRTIGRLQGNDKKLNDIIAEIKNTNSTKYHDKYVWYGEKLYRQEKRKWRLVLPTDIAQQLVGELHQAYSHIGTTRTYKLFKESFTCNSAHKLVKKIIKECDVCQRCKDNGKKNVGETKPVVPTGKGSIVSLDYYGPLPMSTGGVRYILIIVDNFTKYVRLYPIKRATTTVTINKLKQYIQEIGKPESTLSDNGSQFTSRKWTDALTGLGIKTKFTAIRNPCVNIAERVNRQLANMFRVLVGQSHTKWGKCLKLVEACINQTYHETIQTTPYEAQWNRKPDRTWTKYIDQTLCEDKSMVDYEKIHLRIKEKGERRASKLNDRKITRYQVGDLVLVRTNPVSDLSNRVIAKFCALYEGPFRIGDVVGQATYRLYDINKPDVVKGVYNMRQLKTYVKPSTEVV